MITFTQAESEAIVAARAERLSWVAIGLRIHRQPGDVRQHAVSALGLSSAKLPIALKMDRENVLARARAAYLKSHQAAAGVHIDRAPLPAGHPTSWGAICASKYPTYSSHAAWFR
jgi:hypothetical protein